MLVLPLMCFLAALLTGIGASLWAAKHRAAAGAQADSSLAVATLLLLAFGVGSCSLVVPFSELFGSGRHGPRWVGIVLLATIGTVACVAVVRTARARRGAQLARAAFWLANTAW